eukprot:scaffold651814_cov55-Prasinocladus_malaysianus.AAC.1
MHAAEQLVLPRVSPLSRLLIGFGRLVSRISRCASVYTRQLRIPAAGVMSAGFPLPRTDTQV